jgi:hypothetical protein
MQLFIIFNICYVCLSNHHSPRETNKNLNILSYLLTKCDKSDEWAGWF